MDMHYHGEASYITLDTKESFGTAVLEDVARRKGVQIQHLDGESSKLGAIESIVVADRSA